MDLLQTMVNELGYNTREAKEVINRFCADRQRGVLEKNIRFLELLYNDNHEYEKEDY